MDMPQDIMGLSCIMDDLAIKGKVTKQMYIYSSRYIRKMGHSS
jgi:hypothetical protein